MTDTILVVDDEPDLEDLVRQKFRRQIRDGAFAFLFAHDGLEALERVADRPEIDLVVTDINMPRMDGLTLLERLAGGERRLSTVVVSAYGDMPNIRTAMNRGAFDFLTKPIDFTDFETTLRKTLAHVGRLRDAQQRQAAAERAQAALARYFSPNLAKSLAGDASALAGGRREIATLFTDIAGFTALVETLEADVLSALLGEYLTGMTEIVFARDGTVAKIIGDAIHVLFGAPADQPDAATRALDCALAMDEWSEHFRASWHERGVPLGATRIGVHAGPAIVGNFGGGRLFDYTAYGDTINAAARLEAANKTFGTRVCVSAAAASRAEGFVGRAIGDLALRGRTELLRAYEPTRAAPGEPDAYAQAFAKLEAGDPTAVAAFAALVGARPGDPLAQYHLRRLLNGASGVRLEIA
jgi:adenylate cyclase